MSELRKQRLMREALGAQEGEMPGAEEIVRIAGVIALILFVVLFAEYP